MFDVFTETHRSNDSSLQPSYLSLMHSRIERDFRRVNRYIRNRDWHVKSNHILINVLNSIALDWRMDIFEYHRRVRDISADIAKANGISSQLHKAKNNTSNFLGNNVTELYININEPFDLLNIESTWLDLEPVKFLRHDVDSLDMSPLDGSRHEPSGFAVINIDIVKLAIQYRQWRLEWEKNDELDFVPSIIQYVSSYPLANLMYSFYDHCLFNRFMTKLEGGVPTTSINKLPFMVIDHTRHVDRYIDFCLELMKRRSLTVIETLRQFKLHTNDSAFDLYKLPPIYVSRQMEWLFIVARLRVVISLLTISKWKSHSRNRAYVNEVRLYLRRVRGASLFNNTMDNIDTKAILRDFEMTLGDLIKVN